MIITKECSAFISKVFGPVSYFYDVVISDELNVRGAYRHDTPGIVYISSNTDVADSILVHEITHLSQVEYNAGFLIPYYKMNELMSINTTLRNNLCHSDYYCNSPMEIDAILCQLYFYWVHGNCNNNMVKPLLNMFDTDMVLHVLECADEYLVEKEFYEMIYSQIA